MVRRRGGASPLGERQSRRGLAEYLQKSVALIAQNDAFFLLDERRHVRRIIAAFACTRSSRDFCIPTSLSGRAVAGQHPVRLHEAAAREVHGAYWFLFWWLFLHRRLRTRQRGPASCDASGLAPGGLIIPAGVIRFYPDDSGSPVTALASLSASARSVVAAYSPLSAALRQLRHRICCLSPRRSNTRK
jgi:hypothetical protein